MTLIVFVLLEGGTVLKNFMQQTVNIVNDNFRDTATAQFSKLPFFIVYWYIFTSAFSGELYTSQLSEVCMLLTTP